MWGQVYHPSQFEMLESSIPYYQAGLGNRLYYEIIFNDYGRVIKSTGASLDASYKISDISLEYEIVTHSDLTSHISDEYESIFILTEFPDTDKLE